MLPYTRLQILYALLSGAVVVSLFFLAGRPARIRENLLHRFLLTGVLLALGGGVALGVVFGLLGLKRAFAVVAILSYGGGFWLPLVTILSARRTRMGRNAAFLFSILFLALAFDAFVVEPDRLVLRKESIQIPGSTGRPFRLVHVSDQQTVGECERERAAVEMVNGLKPDLIVITGDFVAGPFSDPEPGIAAARKFMGSLHAKYGVLCVAGHSEPEYVRERVLDGLDVTLLRNRARRFPMGGGRTLVLYGIDAIYPEIPREDLRRSPDEFVVVASHVPLYSRHIDGLGFDLHLAGHTHGGQIVIPGLGPPVTLSPLPRKYAFGLHRFGDHWLNVTSGIGMEGHHAPRVRLFCPPEVCLIEIGGGEGEETGR